MNTCGKRNKSKLPGRTRQFTTVRLPVKRFEATPENGCPSPLGEA
ncbi:hypothetical protein CHCC20331_0436 [Bacillus paralicheniformis]|nr:hypothetical protein CHCC5027_3116 [Bacillus paralicheniformis]TWK83260.1 hypothetical protein CHCC20331_0436 [Bacillus paralicheniformis]TWM62064.1 hypothetical protein CHCC14814_3887 [Bacillus paralicheniformis]